MGKKPVIGDSVMILSSYYNPHLRPGDIGVVIEIKEDNGRTYCGLEFKKYINGHDCGGKGKRSSCWRFPSYYITIVDRINKSNTYGIVKFCSTYYKK